MRLKLQLACWLLVTAIVFSVAGCGGSGIPLSDVSGTVTDNGEPAKGVGLRFTPLSGQRASTGQTDQDGNYRLIFTPQEIGAVIGEHEVVAQYKGKLRSKKVVVEDGRTSTIDFELNDFQPYEGAN